MKLDNINIGIENDKRIKIPKEDYPYIKQRHKNGEAIRAIARSYDVDKRLIQFILFPERLELNKKLRKERGGWKQYYNTDTRREEMRKFRKHKRELLTNIAEANN